MCTNKPLMCTVKRECVGKNWWGVVLLGETVAFADPLGGLVSTGGRGLGYLPGAHPQEGATAALR